jgi:hypothetical protein
MVSNLPTQDVLKPTAFHAERDVGKRLRPVKLPIQVPYHPIQP